jgi:ribose 5-phosphate isomerase B
MKVALGADHAGFALKDALKQTLDALGVEHHDFGTSSSDSVDYPDFARAVAEGVAAGRFDRGILVCGTGIGMAIAANKVAGIRAAVVGDEETARLCREHNDANVLTLGARLLPPDRARAIVGAFLGTTFEGGRHMRRVDKIHQLESASAKTT